MTAEDAVQRLTVQVTNLETAMERLQQRVTAQDEMLEHAMEQRRRVGMLEAAMRKVQEQVNMLDAADQRHAADAERRASDATHALAALEALETRVTVLEGGGARP
jgi:chromosome segregation ATPase